MAVCPEWRLSDQHVRISGALPFKVQTAHNPAQHLVQQDTETPPIHFIRIRESLDDFRCEILCCPVKCVCAVPAISDAAIGRPLGKTLRHPGWEALATRWRWCLQIRAGRRRKRLAQTKVRQDNMSIRADQNILRFQIAMHDACRMKTLNADNLNPNDVQRKDRINVEP
jgi:hypothetical protein